MSQVQRGTTLKTPVLLFGIGLVGILLLGARQPAVTSYERATTQVFPTAEQATGDWVRAFVETGSSDKRVQVTLNEISSKTPHTIRQIAASARRYHEKDGVLVTVWFTHPVPKDISLHLTLTQIGAKRFARPVRYEE